MIKPKSLKTIYREGTAELVEKKSRFIGRAFPVENEEAVAQRLDLVRKEHPKLAGHFPYGWLIGPRSKQSDGGEPSGTAGIPILELFHKEGVTNVLVIVPRYYGGVPLGAGGLVRAHGAVARAAVHAAGIIEKVAHDKHSVRCPYNLQGKFQHEFLKMGYTISDIKYTDEVEFIVLAPQCAADAFVAACADISAGNARVRWLSSLYCAKIGDGLKEFDVEGAEKNGT